MHARKLEVAKENAFTLVEILIVVVILGILAAVVTPQFATATDDSRMATAHHELTKLRRAIEIYQVRNANALPNVLAGDGTWGELVLPGQYMSGPPGNSWVGGVNAGVIVIANAPDGAYQTTHGWIFDDTSGQVWAGSFDANDQPYDRP